jgi:penicillin-binding protein 1A
MARKSTRSKKQKAAGAPLWRRIGKWLGTIMVWGLIATLFIAGWFYTDLPDVEDSLAPSRRPTVWVLAQDGKEIAAVGDLYGIPVRLSDLPPALPQAVLATEDRRFYDHFGIDLIGLARAMFANVRAGRIVQGGSTITQQVAKNLFLSPERTIKRKIQEVMLALWLENRFSKDQILELYLNRVYLGSGTYGVDAAARKYFDRPASALNVWQSAMLAGLLKAPSRYNPHSDDERATGRTKVVLANMVAAGYLTEEQAKKARASSGRGTTRRPGRSAPYFVDWVLDQVRDYIGGRDRDLIVKTTLDRDMQAEAERALVATIAKSGKARQIGDGAVLVMAPGGAVRVMVGGSSYADSQFNRATQARRQPGSAFKPFVYLAGLKAGLTPNDMIEDAPVRSRSPTGWRTRSTRWRSALP